MRLSATKRALLLAVLSFILCFAMLLGSTYAWFTSSVVSGSNRIQAGNLSVELYFKRMGDGSTVEWQDADSQTDILNVSQNGGSLSYEPGYVGVTFFKVVSTGSLDLKYQLALIMEKEKPSTNVNDVAFKLSDYLKFGFVQLNKDEVNNYTRQDAKAALENVGFGFTTPHVTGSLLPSENKRADYYALIIYMPENVGNDANRKKNADKLVVQFNIKLVATQLSSESDAFDNLYDKDAYVENWTTPFDVVTGSLKSGIVASYKDNQAFVKVSNANASDDVTATLAASQSGPANITVVAGTTYISYDIKLYDIKDSNGLSVTPNENYTVQMYIGAGLGEYSVAKEKIKLLHNGKQDSSVEITGYDNDSGVLTFTTSSFSTFTAEIAGVFAMVDGKYVTTNQTLAQLIDNNLSDTENGQKTVKLTASKLILGSIKVAENNKGKYVTLDLNGCKISGSVGGRLIYNYANLTIIDSMGKNTGVVSVEGGIVDNDAKGGGSGWCAIENHNVLTVLSGQIFAKSLTNEVSAIVNNGSDAVIHICGGIVRAEGGNAIGIKDNIATSIINISDGLIDAKGNSAIAVFLQSGKELNITGGEIKAEADKDCVGVKLGTNGELKAKDLKVSATSASGTAHGVELGGKAEIVNSQITAISDEGKATGVSFSGTETKTIKGCTINVKSLTETTETVSSGVATGNDNTSVCEIYNSNINVHAESNANGVDKVRRVESTDITVYGKSSATGVQLKDSRVEFGYTMKDSTIKLTGDGTITGVNTSNEKVTYVDLNNVRIDITNTGGGNYNTGIYVKKINNLSVVNCDIKAVVKKIDTDKNEHHIWGINVDHVNEITDKPGIINVEKSEISIELEAGNTGNNHHMYGIQMQNGSFSGGTISNNTITVKNPNNGGSAHGIYNRSDLSNLTINGNTYIVNDNKTTD